MTIPTMQCSGCGATIPVAGVVCPMCHRDKSHDRAMHNRVENIAGAAGIGAFVGGLAGWGIGGFGMAVTLFFLGACAGAVLGLLLVPRPAPKASAPPQVHVTNQPAPQPLPAAIDSTKGIDVASQIRRLHELHLHGALSEQEFEAAKARLLGR